MKTFSINLKDEIVGLKKDINFLDEYAILNESNTNYDQINLAQLLTPFFTPSPELFMEEMNDCIKLLKEFIKLESADSDKPIFITDWDGTMKDYCSQYATNLQPIYSAIGMFKFASQFTRISAVLTAGPLKGPGILDLTAIPLDGPIVFSGSWGREWLINEKRVVHEDGISFEGFNALERLNDEIKELISENSDFSQFALVGSGIQRKVDRLTLGVQTVCKHVPEEISIKYQDAIKERMHRVDPEEKILIFDKSTELEVEVVVGTEDGGVWNKANGVERIVETMNDTLHGPGKVLICGDTSSDLPMVQKANDENEKVSSLFKGKYSKITRNLIQIKYGNG
uniref:Mannosyl-3-phosphoglycerate phosphatase n=1 Tax=Rhabditophanes sp. KR3021 TaxID=114890 RepID=A0AC35UHS0_9BILA